MKVICIALPVSSVLYLEVLQTFIIINFSSTFWPSYSADTWSHRQVLLFGYLLNSFY